MQLEFRAVQRIDIFCTGSYNQKQTSEFISACNCSIRHEHQREGGNGIPLVLVPFFFFTRAAAWKRRSAAMQAVKVFNNNAVSVVMPDGREAILVGNGLGFGRRRGT